MRLDSAGGGTVKVWLPDGDIDDRRRAAASQRDDTIIKLGAYVGLRGFKIPQVQPQRGDSSEASRYCLCVPRGKDTTGSGRNLHDAYLSAPVGRDLRCPQNSANITPRKPFVDLTECGVRAVIKRTAEAVADLTDETISATSSVTNSGAGTHTACRAARARLSVS